MYDFDCVLYKELFPPMPKSKENSLKLETIIRKF